MAMIYAQAMADTMKSEEVAKQLESFSAAARVLRTMDAIEHDFWEEFSTYLEEAQDKESGILFPVRIVKLGERMQELGNKFANRASAAISLAAQLSKTEGESSH